MNPTRRRATVPSRRLAGLLVVALVGLSACGSNSSTAAREPLTTNQNVTPNASSPTYTPSDPGTVIHCLTSAGLPPPTTGVPRPVGVEAEVYGVTLRPLGTTAGQGVDLWFFETRADALENRTLITDSDTETPSSRVVGNVVVRYDDAPRPTDPAVRSLETCLAE